MTIGKVIRRLRIERGLTQSELAERLNMTSQAVSKWENETSCPDISQIVPIASVFGVSTDQLFERGGSDDEEAERLLEGASARITTHDAAGVFAAWSELQEGLKRFPANIRLLMQSIEWGICLAYPENGVYYLPERAEEICRETERQAGVIISSAENTTDILRAHMIVALLNAANGEFRLAERHAANFPWRADMTSPCINAYIEHWRGDSVREGEYLEFDLHMHLEAMLDGLTMLGKTYMARSRYDDASKCFEAALGVIECFFGAEAAAPALHSRESGDIHELLAECFIARGEREEALSELECMADYDLGTKLSFGGEKLTAPFFRDDGYSWYPERERSRIARELLEKLSAPGVSGLSGDSRFEELKNRAEKLG